MPFLSRKLSKIAENCDHNIGPRFQMALIRKRLRVEMWMYERLQELYGAVSPVL
jgi:hypothetical protein